MASDCCIYAFYSHCSMDIKIGIYLFADGRIQSYEDCSTKEEGINHIYDVKAGEKKINEIKFYCGIGYIVAFVLSACLVKMCFL